MAVIGKIGSVEISRISETSLLGYTAQSWFPDFDREVVKPRETWLCPHYHDAENGRIPMPVSSWTQHRATRRATSASNSDPKA